MFSQSFDEVSFCFIDVGKRLFGESMRITQPDTDREGSRGKRQVGYEFFSSVNTATPSSYEIAWARMVPFRVFSFKLYSQVPLKYPLLGNPQVYYPLVYFWSLSLSLMSRWMSLSLPRSSLVEYSQNNFPSRYTTGDEPNEATNEL